METLVRRTVITLASWAAVVTASAWGQHVERPAAEPAAAPYARARRHQTIMRMISDATGHGADTGDDEPSAAASRPPDPATSGPTTLLPPLPEASSSLGAVVSDGFLYVYGGHIAPVHTYSTEAVSGRFHRLALRAAEAAATSGDGEVTPPAWEELASGPRLQGMNLAAHAGTVYRAGGMDPRNAPGAGADNFSVASAACFDPAVDGWSDLPRLPEPRSSHDLVVLGDTLYAVGGWTMLGADGGEAWCETMAALDLTDATLEWRSIPQPFTRRALVATAFRDRLWVIGGFTDTEEVSTHVDVFDPRTGTWSRGPDLPVGSFNGFAPAACVVDGRLLVSVADGSLLALDDESRAWETVTRTTPRIVHRMVPTEGGVILVGGAAGKDNLDRVERVPLP